MRDSRPGCVHLFFLASWLIIYATWATAVPEQSDTVTLKNGDHISGLLLRIDTRIVQLKSAALGEVTIHWPDISEVQSRNRRWRTEEEHQGQLSAYMAFHTAVLRTRNSMVVVEADSGVVTVASNRSIRFDDQEHATAGPTQLMGVKAPPHAPGPTVAITLNAPESVVIGTQNQQVFGGSLRILHNEPDLCGAPSWFSTLLAAANHNKSYKVKNPAVVTDTFDGTMSLKNRLSSQSSVAGYLIADLYGNSSLGIGLQQSYGAGISRVLFSNSCHGTTPILPKNYRLAVNGDAGLRYIHQRLYAPGGSDDLAGLRLGENLVFVPFFKDRDGNQKERFSIDQSLWVTPMLNNGRAVQAGGSFGISFPVGKGFSIGLAVEDDFFNNAPKAKRKNYIKSALSVTYSFPSPTK